MKPRELRNLGIPQRLVKCAIAACAEAARQRRLSANELRTAVRAVIDKPSQHTADPVFGTLAAALIDTPQESPARTTRAIAAPWKQWGDDLDAESIRQLEHACSLPVAIRGALMPDAHVGYGLPIGGVLATDNTVIPYAVGVDIACRMKLSVFDLPVRSLTSQTDRLVNALQRETQFGIGAAFKKPRDHPVMDHDWSVSPITQHNRDKAWCQLGTSGSGNHFVEYGILTVPPRNHDSTTAEAHSLNLQPGEYLALLSHSGSRGTGAAVASHYSRLAMEQHPELPKQLRYLAWLEMDSAEGQEYWSAMNLMGEYAAANHAVIHSTIARNLGASVIAAVENHHNFAWRETHDDREVIVHRKGATPAGVGVLGIIPGSMASPAYVVRGRGSNDSLHSASHGAGRIMSRTQARQQLKWADTRKLLNQRGVTLLSAGIDEVPFVYKDIDRVMSQQRDLVDVIARFDPRVVRMAQAGERPED